MACNDAYSPSTVDGTHAVTSGQSDLMAVETIAHGNPQGSCPCLRDQSESGTENLEQKASSSVPTVVHDWNGRVLSGLISIDSHPVHQEYANLGWGHTRKLGLELPDITLQRPSLPSTSWLLIFERCVII